MGVVRPVRDVLSELPMRSPIDVQGIRRCAGSLYSSSSILLELFCQKIAYMPGRKILQFAKNLIAVLLIEIWRLKAESVQINILCATLPSLSSPVSKGDAHSLAPATPPRPTTSPHEATPNRVHLARPPQSPGQVFAGRNTGAENRRSPVLLHVVITKPPPNDTPGGFFGVCQRRRWCSLHPYWRTFS